MRSILRGLILWALGVDSVPVATTVIQQAPSPKPYEGSDGAALDALAKSLK